MCKIQSYWFNLRKIARKFNITVFLKGVCHHFWHNCLIKLQIYWKMWFHEIFLHEIFREIDFFRTFSDILAHCVPLSNEKVLEKIALGQIFCENLRRERKRGCKIMKFFRWYFFSCFCSQKCGKRFCYSILNDLFHCQKLAKCLRLYKSFAWWCSLDYILIFFVIRYYLLL